MGIRYDKDNGRATNGPLIFFSDPMSEGSFSEEIRGAIGSGLCFYAYRMPGDMMISFGSSEGAESGIGTPGFVIGYFNPALPYLTIPYRGGKRGEAPVSGYVMPRESTSVEAYNGEVEEIVRELKAGAGRKVVAARVIVKDEKIDLAEKFYELVRRFPESFVFSFGTPATGCWIGASPELLLEGREGTLTTMALAGTRDSGTPGEWDAKNIEEQQIVADYICRSLEDNGLHPELSETFTKKTGTIEHICTPISAKRIKEGGNGFDRTETWGVGSLEKLLRDLSPTPALCGSPKEFALGEIGRLENFDRGCYGGFCGPYHSPDNFRFQVVLRCASVSQEAMCIYTGGGITSLSKVSAEWEETSKKAFNTFGLR